MIYERGDDDGAIEWAFLVGVMITCICTTRACQATSAHTYGVLSVVLDVTVAQYDIENHYLWLYFKLNSSLYKL